MGNRIRVFLLSCLVAAAGFTAVSAFRSIRSPWDRALPAGLYEGLTRDAENADFYLRGRGGYIIVVPKLRGAEPEQVTAIELSTLRIADRAMIERGIPAADRSCFLQLLEDLGS